MFIFKKKCKLIYVCNMDRVGIKMFYIAICNVYVIFENYHIPFFSENVFTMYCTLVDKSYIMQLIIRILYIYKTLKIMIVIVPRNHIDTQSDDGGTISLMHWCIDIVGTVYESL